MVSLVWGLVALFAGLMIYITIPVVGSALPVSLRYKIGTPYLKNGARALGQFSFLRRGLSGYDVKQITVDQEQKKLKVSLKSPMLGDEVEFPFKDPASNIKRLFNKPVGINYEHIPAALSAELAEFGHWVRKHTQEKGLVHGTSSDDPSGITVNPYVEIKDTMRVVDPADAFELVPHGVEPENIKTAENLTKHRFSHYGSTVSMTEAASAIMGFIVGIAGVAGFNYIQTEVMGGGGQPVNPVPISIQVATELAGVVPL